MSSICTKREKYYTILKKLQSTVKDGLRGLRTKGLENSRNVGFKTLENFFFFQLITAKCRATG